MSFSFADIYGSSFKHILSFCQLEAGQARTTLSSSALAGSCMKTSEKDLCFGPIFGRDHHSNKTEYVLRLHLQELENNAHCSHKQKQIMYLKSVIHPFF